MKQSWLKVIAAFFSLALIAAACGGSDSDSGSSDSASATDNKSEEVIESGSEAEGDVDTEVEEVVAESSYGGNLTIGLEAEATGLRPWEDACSSPCLTMVAAVYDTLVAIRADGTVGPWLASDWSSNADFTEWTFNLVDGVEFHNGNPFTAQTLVDMFPMQQIGAAAGGIVTAAGLTEVVAVDDTTVKYVLSSAHSAFPSFLIQPPLGAPFDPVAASEDMDGYSMNPIGTGPFMVENRDLDNETLLVRNPNYWMNDADGNQLPYLDSVSFRPIPDEGTRLDSLLSGTTDAMQT